MARSCLTAKTLRAIRDPIQPRAVLAAWIASAPWGIASQLRLEDVLRHYPWGLRPLVTSRKGLPLFGRDELIALLEWMPGKSAANLRAHLQQVDLELPTTAVITEAREHSDQPRQPPDDQAA